MDIERFKPKTSNGEQPGNDSKNIILTYLAYINPPISLDKIISLTEASPVQILQILEGLRKQHFVSEKKETGKGFYYPGSIDLHDYIHKNLHKRDIIPILNKLVIRITESKVDNKEKTISLARLYFELGVKNSESLMHIMKAANILENAGEKKRAIQYYDFIIEFFLNKSSAITEQLSLLKVFLDSVYHRFSLGVLYHIPNDMEEKALKKAIVMAKKLKNDQCYSLKINQLLGFMILHGQIKEPLKYLNDLIKIAADSKDEKLIKNSFLFTIKYGTILGRFTEVIESYEKMIEKIGEDTDDLIYYLFVALSLIFCGKISQGLDMIHSTRVKAEKANLSEIINYADYIEIISLIETRKISDAERFLTKSLEYNEDSPSEHPLSRGIYNCCMAFLLCIKEDYEQAYKYMKNACVYKMSKGVKFPHPFCPWVLEALYLFELNGFSDEYVNLNNELNEAINGENLLQKGVAYKYRALCNLKKQKSENNIESDLKHSRRLLKQSGAIIELARTEIVMKDYYMSKGNLNKAKTLMERTWATLIKNNEKIIPADILKNMPPERMVAHLVEQIISINNALAKIDNPSTLFNMIINAAINLTDATLCGICAYKKGDLEIIATRNIDFSNLKQPLQKFLRKFMIDSLTNNKDIEIPMENNQFNEQFAKLDISSFVGIPFNVNGSGSGLFFVGKHTGKGKLSKNAFLLLKMFASQTEIGLSTLNVYEKIRKKKENYKEELNFCRSEIGHDHPFQKIIGQSEVIKKCLGLVEHVSKTDSLVLVTGKTGVGKELIARAIHDLSKRRNGPFIPVNLSTFPNDLVSSELFGHEKGAFSGASERKKGRFELAGGGSIFLDEIGDLSMEVQLKLLRVIQDGIFERLGSSKSIQCNFRIIVATNKNIYEEAQKGNFREDLYYRLNVFPIHVPPLRERKMDIPILAHHFFILFAKMFNRKMGRKITTEEFKKLMFYSWPGNVRELKHYIQRVVILFDGQKLRLPNPVYKTNDHNSEKTKKNQLLSDVVREHIVDVLNSTFWKIYGPSGAASILGMPPSTLCYRMKKLGIKKPSKTDSNKYQAEAHC